MQISKVIGRFVTNTFSNIGIAYSVVAPRFAFSKSLMETIKRKFRKDLTKREGKRLIKFA